MILRCCILVMQRWYLGACVSLLLLYTTCGWTQNLVPNPNFTVYAECPYTKGQIKLAEPWYSPNGKTTDFIHSCGERGYLGIPENAWGYQHPAAGSGYAGIRTWLHPSLGFRGEVYREYLAVQMKDTLEKGEMYYISFKVSVGDSAQYISDDIGLAFSDTIFPNINLLEFTPAISNPDSRFINHFNDWLLVDGFYEAKGDELHLVIGNFKDNEHTSLQKSPGDERPELGTYFYIDEVVVEPCKQRFPEPLIVAEDSSLCPGEELTLGVAMTDDAEIFWENGSQDTSRVVNSPGTYILDMEIRGCMRKDTIEINAAEVPELTLGNDTTLCPGEMLSLELPEKGIYYTLNDNVEGLTFLLDAPGTYVVQADNRICTNTDSIHISFDTPEANPPFRDTTICHNDSIQLIATREGITYQWNNANTTNAIGISESGEYWVDVESRCFSQREYFNVDIQECSCEGLFPNVFTPNNDGFNDMYAPELNPGVINYQLKVWDQWGSIRFQTNDVTDAWDGTSSLGMAKEGVYFWKAEFTCRREGEDVHQVKQGSLNLFR